MGTPLPQFRLRNDCKLVVMWFKIKLSTIAVDREFTGLTQA